MRRLFFVLAIALRALWRNPLRTLLTLLGIVIGVAAVIAMVGIGSGASLQLEQQVAALGRNVVMVMAGGGPQGGVFAGAGESGTLTIEDADAIAREVKGAVHAGPEVRGIAQVAAGNANWRTSVLGVNEHYLNLREWRPVIGGFFNPVEVRSAARVAVLGQTTRNHLYGAADPVGSVLRIDGAPYEIIGVLATKGSNMMGHDQDDVVLVPHTTAMRRLYGETTLRAINLGVATPEQIPDVVAQIEALLRARHRLPADREDDFSILTQDEIAAFAGSTTRIMTALLGAIAAVSLLVGGIGIMNIMLVSVTERTREIGVRLALGARRCDILRQFLAEAVVLGLVGGGLGVAFGVGLSRGLAALMSWPAHTSPAAILGAFFFSAAVGVAFGYYPARRAARLDPIEALRRE
jgi:putative ABC transport system permease protein